MWIHLVNSCVFNAHILHKSKSGKLTLLEFCMKVVSQTIEKYGEDTEIINVGVDLLQQIIHSDQLNDISFHIFQQRKKMPPNSVLFLKNAVSKKNHNMNVSGVMQHLVLLHVLKFITKLRYFKCQNNNNIQKLFYSIMIFIRLNQLTVLIFMLLVNFYAIITDRICRFYP